MTGLTPPLVKSALTRVIDPETHLSIMAMGLIYSVEVSAAGDQVHIQYTLTTPLCPLAGIIHDRIRAEISAEFPDLSITPGNVVLELVFDPPWSLDRLSEEARAELGL